MEEFGEIQAWEKEDKVQPGIPMRQAGFCLRTISTAAIPKWQFLFPIRWGVLVADSARCQRMYDFQSGRYNFNLRN